MDILRFDLLIITTLLLAFGLILIATQADGAIDIEVRSKTNYQLLTTNQLLTNRD